MKNNLINVIDVMLQTLSLFHCCNKGRGMCHPVCGMMHIKEPLLLIGNKTHVAAASFLSRYQRGPLPYV